MRLEDMLVKKNKQAFQEVWEPRSLEPGRLFPAHILRLWNTKSPGIIIAPDSYEAFLTEFGKSFPEVFDALAKEALGEEATEEDWTPSKIADVTKKAIALLLGNDKTAEFLERFIQSDRLSQETLKEIDQYFLTREPQYHCQPGEQGCSALTVREETRLGNTTYVCMPSNDPWGRGCWKPKVSG
jgi:hypothetical protein